MPRWRLAALVLAVVSLGHPSVTVLGAVAQDFLAHVHRHAHGDLGRAAEHGHHHEPSLAEHGHEATPLARATGAPPAPPGLWELASAAAHRPAGAFVPGPHRGSGCDPPAEAPRNSVLRI